MASVQYLREFINERLTAAAEQILLEFEKTIVQYEEEIDRQRRLLDMTWKPEIKLHRTDLQHVFKEEEGLTDQALQPSLGHEEPELSQIKEEQEELCNSQEEVLPEEQLWNQERSSSLDQEEPEPPQIKEEEEELCSSQEEEQLGLKEETDTFMVTAAEEGDHSEPEGGREQLLPHSCPETQTQDQEGSKKVDSGSTGHTNRSHSNNAECCPITGSQCKTETGKKSLKCDVCGETTTFKKRSQIKEHYTIHTGEKPHSCEICQRRFAYRSNLLRHMRIHTGEKPHSCEICQRRFAYRSNLLRHMRIHTGERPYLCQTCGKKFTRHTQLSVHVRTHTGEKPFHCKRCGKMFARSSNLLEHVRTHTGEKPYPCNTCGKNFTCCSHLLVHIRTHTGEKPYLCKTCGKMFTRNSVLLRHMKTHR